MPSSEAKRLIAQQQEAILRDIGPLDFQVKQLQGIIEQKYRDVEALNRTAEFTANVADHAVQEHLMAQVKAHEEAQAAAQADAMSDKDIASSSNVTPPKRVTKPRTRKPAPTRQAAGAKSGTKKAPAKKPATKAVVAAASGAAPVKRGRGRPPGSTKAKPVAAHAQATAPVVAREAPAVSPEGNGAAIDDAFM